MIIKFQILKSIVREVVQTATYIKGQIDRTAQNASNAVLQTEIVGDETLHERNFTHDFDTALERLKVILVDYILPTPQTIGDNVIYYGNKEDDIVEFVLSVSRRYNGTLTDPLARLCSKFVEDYIIFQWWLKTTNTKQAEPYQATLQIDEQEIRKCFILSGPLVPTVPYTTTLTAKIGDSDVSDGGSISIGADEKEVAFTYTIDKCALDDIEAHSSCPCILEVHRSPTEHTFVILPIREGSASVTLFSRHSDDIKVEFNVTIEKETTND